MTKAQPFFSVRDMVLCALFTALTAAGAFMRIPLPYVPFSLQFLFTNLSGLLLGSKKGALSICLYIALGLLGLPIFTQGGGPAYVLQPSFGYIPGFALGAYLAGRMVERRGESLKTYLLAGFANFAIVFALGMAHLYLISSFYLHKPMGLWNLLVAGFLPFIPGDVLTVVVSAYLAKRLRPLVVRGKKTD
jgi:biotin transport system substrate-specific component